MSGSWAYAVTTVPERRDTLLPRTLRSLANAGFDKPRLLVDGADSGYQHFGLEVTYRTPRVRAFGNWILGLWELYLRNPTYDRFAIFQDDLIISRNARQYLDRCDYHPKGYWNLYTFPKNEAVAQAVGWTLTALRGHGAVGLAFSREAVTKILASYDHIVDRPIAKDVAARTQGIDAAVRCSLEKAGFRELCHFPSLLQHTGTMSTINSTHNNQALSGTFRGEDFDCLTLLPGGVRETAAKIIEAMPLGSTVASALSLVGITPERVSSWLGEPCGCDERKRKWDAATAWAARVVRGEKDNAEKYLNEIMGQDEREIAAIRKSLADDLRRLETETDQRKRSRLQGHVRRYEGMLRAIGATP